MKHRAARMLPQKLHGCKGKVYKELQEVKKHQQNTYFINIFKIPRMKYKLSEVKD